MRLRFILSITATAGIAACAGHTSGPQLVPAPLADALLSARSSSPIAPRIFVGTLPTDFPAILLPPGDVKIIGGMSSGGESIGVFSDESRDLAPVFERVFEQKGYSRPPAEPSSGFMSRGGASNEFCGKDGFVNVTQLTGEARHFARVSFRATQRDACRLFRSTPIRGQLKVPELKAPAGVRVNASGGGGSDYDVHSNAEVTGTDLDMAALLAHYSNQLVAAGWTADTAAVSKRMAAQYLEARSDAGQVWQGYMLVTGSTTAAHLSLQMHIKTP